MSVADSARGRPAAPDRTPGRPRVLVVGPLPPPLGGVQRMNQLLLHSSLAEDFDLHAVDTSRGSLRWAVESQSWRTPFSLMRDIWRLAGALVRVRPRIVYVHAASGYSFTRDALLMLLARASGARVVCHYHGTLHTSFPSALTPFGRAAGRALMSTAHRVIVLSPRYRDVFAAAWGRQSVTWSPNLAEVPVFAIAADGPIEGAEPGDRVVLFVGRLSAPKGIFDLFEAAPRVLSACPQARFALMGVAETEAREPELRAEVARRGIRERVLFLGSREGSDAARVFAAAHVLVVPSWTEAFPLVIPEGMAAGLPIVASDVGAIPDFVHDGEDGFLVPPRDPAALADGILRLLGDEAMRSRISRHVRERAGREFAVEEGAARVRLVLTELSALR
jgi:glycosyltransferase involved in cell wall biosynthesis